MTHPNITVLTSALLDTRGGQYPTGQFDNLNGIVRTSSRPVICESVTTINSPAVPGKPTNVIPRSARLGVKYTLGKEKQMQPYCLKKTACKLNGMSNGQHSQFFKILLNGSAKSGWYFAHRFFFLVI